MATSLGDRKTRLIIYIRSSTNPENLVKIGPADLEIIGSKGIVKNKKQQQNILPANLLLAGRAKVLSSAYILFRVIIGLAVRRLSAASNHSYATQRWRIHVVNEGTGDQVES